MVHVKTEHSSTPRRENSPPDCFLFRLSNPFGQNKNRRPNGKSAPQGGRGISSFGACKNGKLFNSTPGKQSTGLFSVPAFESLRAKEKRLHGCEAFFLGAPEGIRTPDLLIRSQTLYPAELRAHMRFLRTVNIIDGNARFVKRENQRKYTFFGEILKTADIFLQNPLYKRIFAWYTN